MNQYADTTFSLNMQELFKIVFAIPVESKEAERSFLCRIHIWLGSGSYIEMSIKGIYRFSYVQ